MLAGLLALVLLPAGAAQAHPLGNFSVNYYHHLELHPDRLDLLSIVDTAEIPTAQELQTLFSDQSPSRQQLRDAAPFLCAPLIAAAVGSVDGQPLNWTMKGTLLETVAGAGDLPTLRLTCRASATADFSTPRSLSFADTYDEDRVGWHEITADGVGVRLLDSPVPVESPTDQLRNYPVDLLASPLDERGVELETEPGENTGTDSALDRSTGDPFSSFIASMDRALQDLIGGELTPLVGTFAVLLAVLLGCGHALLPGHGKTMIAAYLAARRGRARDAVIVGATVTATHTAGVLLLGLAISVSSTLAGEQVLRWLGIISGLLVAGIGAFMLRNALQARRVMRADRSEQPSADVPPALVTAPVEAGWELALPVEGDRGDLRAPHTHERGGHDHEQGHDQDHGHPHGPGGHSHGAAWGAGHTHEPAVGRAGLIGMGFAGGLVPSPSALIVLLASIALGRTAFGVFLVIAYGLGMALTLTVAGLLLVRLRGRLARRAARTDGSGTRSRAAAVMAALPTLTAVLVLLVGLGLAVRGLLLGG